MLKIIVAIAIFLVIICFKPNCGARILTIVPTPAYSHQNSFRPIWRELSLRGHQVTLITTDPINDASLSNLTEIDIHFAYDIWNKKMKGVIEKNPLNVFSLAWSTFPMISDLLDQELGHPKIQAMIKNETETFDLVMVEAFSPTVFAFAERFKCPFITISSFEGYFQLYEQIGNPSHPITNPDRIISFDDDNMSSFKNRLLSVSLRLFFDALVYSARNEDKNIVRRHFGLGYSDMHKLAEYSSMLFVNSNPILFPVRPLLPNVIQYGDGSHLTAKQELPKKLQIFLDSASEGFVYFSLGSNVKSKDLPQEIKNTLIETFSELPCKVLWKFELDQLDNLPANVMILKWLPQQDVLRHPNIKLFITQGGLQSIEESLHNYVPIIGLPFWADQHENVKQAVKKGMGLSADPFSLNKKDFKSIILEVINNPIYLKQVKQLSDLIRDQPMTGLERAIWWTEYVIRHKGASHFKSPALGIPFYQYYLLDVIGFYFAILFAIIYLIIVVFRLICKAFKFVFRSKSKLKSQ